MGARGPKPKEKPKRISGTGYTYAESRNLKYCKKAEDGTYEIDTEAINKAIEDYTSEEKRLYYVKQYKNRGKKDEEVTEIPMYKPISEPGLRTALGIKNKETFKLWAEGFVNREQKGNDMYTANTELSDALRAGETAVAKYLCEEEDSKKSSLTIRRLESMGEITPSKQITEVSGGIKLGLGSLSKFAQ